MIILRNRRSGLLFLSMLLLLIGACSEDIFAARTFKVRSQMAPACTSTQGSSLRYADLFAEGNTAVMGSYGCRGAFIFDITNPEAPVLASWYNPGANQQFLEAIIVGNRGYFGSGTGGGGVHIVDLTNPYSPVFLGQVNTSNGNGFNSIHEMVVFSQNGATFLITNVNTLSNKTLKIINVTNPAAPVFVRDLIPTDPQWVHAMVVKGNRLFTSGWGTSSTPGRTEIYDISNIATTAPTLLGYIADTTSPTAGNNMHSAWPSEDGNYLYSAREVGDPAVANPGDIRVYDISNVSTPLLIKKIPSASLGINASTPHNPVVRGNKLYVSWYQAGLQVFDLSNPRDPRRMGEYDTYLPAFGREERAAAAQYDPSDVMCGRLVATDQSVTGYDGAWAVYPYLDEKRVLIGDLARGIFIVDVKKKNVVSDYDGDGKTDVSTFRPSNGDWEILMSATNRSTIVHFGLPGDVMAPGDYDGDGKADLAVFRPSNGFWYREGTTSGFSGIQFGLEGDVPVASDYDGDGKTDIAVWRPSTGAWYILRSTAGFQALQWGSQDDKAIAGDYDGDGKSDVAVWRPSTGTWYIRSSATSAPIYRNFGTAGDRAVEADFDGNGVTDIAVFRPSSGTWYVLDPWTSTFRAFQFGSDGDIPVPADYDGDSIDEISVFRPSANLWYTYNLVSGGITTAAFGRAGDQPAPSSVQPQ